MTNGFDVASAVALAIGLAACAGLRALLPIFLTGAVARLGWLPLGASFQFLATDRALVIFGAATVLEMAGDKIPALDHALDVVHTFLRPLSGSILAAAVLSRVSEPLHALVFGIVLGAPTAIVPHVARSGLRVASTFTTAGFANPFLSVLEDVATFVLFVAVILVPLVVAAGLLVAFVLLARRMAARKAPAAAVPR